MSKNQDKNGTSSGENRTPVVVEWIKVIGIVVGVIGTIAVAVISNLDKLPFGQGGGATAPDTERAEGTAPVAALPAPIPNTDRCDVTIRTPRADHFFLVGWGTVPGAATYSVEYDCFGCRDFGRQWHSLGAGAPWHLRTGLGLRPSGNSAIYSSSIHQDLKEQGGTALRWRVWGVDHDGQDGSKSAWCRISFGGSQ